MQKNKKRKLIIIIVLVCSVFFIINFTNENFWQEDLLFFRFFYLKNKQEESIKQNFFTKEISEKVNSNNRNIYFNVKYQNNKIKPLNLLNTVDNETLVYEKIAPGTMGYFNILLKSNQNINYKIIFESLNDKPSNLVFFSKGEKYYDSLENLSDELIGTLKKNKEQSISIYWKWKYEINSENNVLDTLEAKNIRNYNFLICVQGY